jgi:hypothetical protein
MNTKAVAYFSGVIVDIILIIALGIAGPLLTIASMNALFNLGIAYSFWNWLSVVWLGMVTFGGVNITLSQISKKL